MNKCIGGIAFPVKYDAVNRTSSTADESKTRINMSGKNMLKMMADGLRMMARKLALVIASMALI